MSDGRRYQILGVLGKGGFGTVYKAELLGEGGFKRTVALKVLNAEMREMEDVASRLRDEARLLGLLRHRAILGVDGLVRLSGRWTVVMEFINGADLHRVSSTSKFPLGPALEVIGEVASALHVAYTTPNAEGVPMQLLHRDIKPQNVLLTAAGEIKVLDFGIARAEFSNREAKTQSVLYGSVAYMAPERLDFEELHEGDVYALGVVFYELLTGEQFGKASIRGERHAKAIEGALHRVRKVVGDAPGEFIELLGAMLSYDPEERPSAREVERRCRALRSQLDSELWLRDWAEMVVPEVLKGMQDLAHDDYSGSILVESKSVSALSRVAEETIFIEDDRVPEAKPPSKPKRSILPGLAVGGSMAGCLLLGVGLGGVVVLFMIIALFSMPSNLDTGGGVVVFESPQPNSSGSSSTATVAEEEVGSYGPPAGYNYKSALTKPWTRMKLPVGQGNVTYSTDSQLVLMYGKGPLRPMVKRWENALVGYGFKQTMAYDSDEACTRLYEWRGEEYALSTVAVKQQNDNVMVSIAKY